MKNLNIYVGTIKKCLNIKEYTRDGDYTFISNETNISEELEAYSPDILKIIETYKSKEDINPHGVNPIYLKSTEAEEKANGD